MTLLTGPLMSDEARGTLADLLTYSRRRGRNVAGRRNNPKQPQTEAQRATRIYVAWLTRAWAAISADRKKTWHNFADTPLLSPYHAYLSHNVNRMKNMPGLWTNPAVFENWPGQAYPVTRSGLAANINTLPMTPGKGYADFNVQVLDKRDNWGFAIFRVLGPDQPATYRRLVAIATVQTNGLHTIRIANLAPGLNKFYCQRFTTDGATTAFWSLYQTTVL